MPAAEVPDERHRSDERRLLDARRPWRPGAGSLDRRRDDAGAEVTYHLEVSDDLSTWKPVDGEMVWVTPLDAIWEGLLTEIRGLGTDTFLRLRVEKKGAS